MPNSLCITLSNPQDVYTPGSVVEGIAHISVEEDIKARSLKIAIEGRAHTCWRASRTRTVRRHGRAHTETYKERYSASVIYASDEMMAWISPSDDKEVLPAGSYQFPFAFSLPANLPPSFEGIYGYIRYVVKMELDRPWRFNKRNQKAFTVVPAFDLNTISEAILPVKRVKVKRLGIILFRHGEVTVECEAAKGGFVPGEMVVVSARVVNDSSKDIVKAHLKLVEISNYVAYRISRTLPPSSFITSCGLHERRQQRRVLATGEQELFIAKNTKGDVQLYLQVPPTVPSFDCCPIIKVEYIVEVEFKSTGSVNSDIDTSLPIIVGTIPVRRITSHEDVPSSSIAHPSAPPLEMEVPPEYLAGNSAMEAVLPPTYEESVNGVDGTTLEDSMEPFVPRYPFFRQLSDVHKKMGGGDS